MWAYIKKAINSNLTKALDILIAEKHNATDELITAVKAVTDEINSSRDLSRFRTAGGGVTTPVANTEYLMMEVSGKGILKTIYPYIQDGMSLGVVRIRVDNTSDVFMERSSAGHNAGRVMYNGTWPSPGVPFDLRFTSNLKIYQKRVSGTTYIGMAIDYVTLN